jgi:DNA-binding transcriptional regulator YiaG
MDRKDVLAAVRAQILLASGEARRIRENAHVSRSDVAQVLGVQPAAVSHWENRRRRPRTKVAARYGELLDSLEQMTTGAAHD